MKRAKIQTPGRTLGSFSVLILLLGTPPALSHHSFAMYDTTELRTLTGRLTRFIPGANHAQLIFELVDESGETVVGANGEPERWGVETGPAAAIARQGITVASFPLGTVITVTLHPLRDGRNFGALVRDTQLVQCGPRVPAGGCTPSTGDVYLGAGAQ
ncbi:MAG TPA: DUF6152 family protein [Gammaproteobacteria bacterium]